MNGYRRTGWVAGLAVAATMAMAGLWVSYQIDRETERGLGVLGAEQASGPTALVVYHAGMSDFQEEVSRAFAAGLVEVGWHVEITTASRRAPTDLSRYELLVLGGPTYWWAPSPPIRRYLRRLGDLQGEPTVILLTGMGATRRAQRLFEAQVQEQRGELVRSVVLTSMRPNDETDPRPNREVALERASYAGREIAPPAR